jgi:hypothetical protein
MTQDINLPFDDIVKYIPLELRNPVAVSLARNLFNKFLTNDESASIYGYIGQKVDPEVKTQPVDEPTSERRINQLVPVLSFKVGTETFSFTSQDIVNKAKVLGLNADQRWLYSQGNNLVPPINFSKFVDFFTYYWVAQALPNRPSLPWNPDLLAEHYVIAPPRPTDATKLSVVTVDRPDGTITTPFTRTGSGLVDQVFTVFFTSSTQFTISLSDDMGGTIVPVGTQPPLVPGVRSTPVTFSATTPVGVKVVST